ncbi:hypothetical protein [Paenibacillus sp. LPE1-1-1.1]|uniref:hypothetical protein n=1 Tax=Paenibacillus sp. LPE1-1-1.1 TaxID=3135230 RepID=UPI003413A0FF
MVNKVLVVYRAVIVCTVLLVVYSCYIFNSKIDEQKTKWTVETEQKSISSDLFIDNLQFWKTSGLTFKEKHNNEIEYITTSKDPAMVSKELELHAGPVMTSVELETNRDKLQLFWSTEETSNFTEENSVVLNSSTGKYIYLIDADVLSVRVDPSEELNQKVMIKKISIKKDAK